MLTTEARLAPGTTIQAYRDKATVQVYSSRSKTGPSKVCVRLVLTKMLELTQLYQKTFGTFHNMLCLSSKSVVNAKCENGKGR